MSAPADTTLKLGDSMTSLPLPAPPKKRAILVIEPRLTAEEAARLGDDLRTAIAEDEWPMVLSVGGPAYWLPVGEDDAMELLRAAYTYISNFVPITEGEINGFGVEAWCASVERLEDAL